MTVAPEVRAQDAEAFHQAVTRRVAAGARFAALLVAEATAAGTRLVAVLAERGALGTEACWLAPGATAYRSLSPEVPSATWYEREIHDLFGLRAEGHPWLSPLVLPLAGGERAPLAPRSRQEPAPRARLDLTPPPAYLHGEGVFTFPYGPVRSGVFESVEYSVETPGEDIPHLRPRPYYKHRGLEARFAELGVDDGVLLAERYEGIASVAHALAFCNAAETTAGATVPLAAQLVRVVHAELERVANHLDSVVRHCEGAGQAVALARFGLHKESVMRLRGRLCGSRFGRGVVVPGGVSAPPAIGPAEALGELDSIQAAVRKDLRLLMSTPSFTDRLRGTGAVGPLLAGEHGALGPVGRASGVAEDVRFSRPYGAYALLGHSPAGPSRSGDALARQSVRNEEMRASFHLVRQALHRLAPFGAADIAQFRQPIGPVTGEALASVEAPQGELLYFVRADNGRLLRVKPRSASFHNLSFFAQAFPKDILTDFAFIEASFSLSPAGVAG